MKRGVLYIVWGNYNRQELQRSIDSLRPFGYDYHVAEIEDEGIGLTHKAKMYDLSPFDTTLFLDTDTVVHGNLDYGFEMAEQFGIACCIAPASSAYLAGKEIGMKVNKNLPQYNTGVVFFSKDWTLQGNYGSHDQPCNFFDSIYGMFTGWKHIVKLYPLSKLNDQPSFSKAIQSEYINPYILPRNWNYRAKVRYEARILHGDLKILHAR